MNNDNRLHELAESYFAAVGRARRIEAGEEAGGDDGIEAALDDADAATEETAAIVADTADGAAAQVAILRDLAGVLGDTGELMAAGGSEAQMLDRVLEAHGHKPLTA